MIFALILTVVLASGEAHEFVMDTFQQEGTCLTQRRQAEKALRSDRNDEVGLHCRKL